MLSKPTEYFAENSKIRSIVISWFEGIFERKERKSRNTSNHLLLPSRNESQKSSKNTLSTLPDPTSRDRGCRSKVKGAEQVDRLDRIRRERERGGGGNSRIAVNEDNWICMETGKPFNRNLASSSTFQPSLAYSNLRHRDQRRRRANFQPQVSLTLRRKSTKRR